MESAYPKAMNPPASPLVITMGDPCGIGPELIVKAWRALKATPGLAFGVIGLAESTSRHWLGLGLGPGLDADAFADTVAQLAWSGLRGIQR